ncbi:MAG: rhodanese-like domain-containing protein [Prosthecobacter sp.]|nr:rhodanese-like domain-containing protein [Prosthecobacter sp.]
MKRISIIFTLLSLLSLATAFAEDKAKHVNAEQAAELIQDGKVTVIDVRTADEFSEGHIKGAKNFDILSKDFAANLDKMDKKQPVLVHCQAGSRSARSLPTLEKLGFAEVYHLDGGMNDWLKAGKPVVK